MINLFPKANLSKALELYSQLVGLNLDQFTTLVKAQTEATTGLVELTAARVEAAIEVKDFDGLKDFTQAQTKIVQSNIEKWMADCKSIAEDTMSYGKEVQQILFQSIEAVTPEAATPVAVTPKAVKPKTVAAAA